MDFAVWAYSTQQVATKYNANLEALKLSLKKAWDDLDVNTCVPSLTRTRRDSELSSRLKVDDLKTVHVNYLLLFNEHFVRFVENNIMFKQFYTVLNAAPYLFPTLYFRRKRNYFRKLFCFGTGIRNFRLFGSFRESLIRKLVLNHFSNLYAETTRQPQSRYTHPDEPEILQHEVENTIDTSKTSISPGPDQITMLQLKLGIESLAPHLTTALNQVLTNGRTPEDWKTVKISLLPKTTKPKKMMDYRPAALSSIGSKFFTKSLTRRITAKSEDYLEELEAEFRRGRGCADNIEVVSQMWEKCTELKIRARSGFPGFHLCLRQR
uniref:Reverse transcriptase domain-containing protein n=1 Tax=Caenorhabditis japonica TaxID=281687 RepID=A0A8R1ICV6_CAEJA